MVQEQLDGIANATYSTIETLTWETQSDWDNAVSEAGVVHESIGDYAGPGTIQLGYPSFDRGGTNLYAYYSLTEDSGSTANDVSGNNRDADYSGPTLGQTGLHNTDAPSFDGTDDHVTNVPHPIEGQDTFSFAVWLRGDAYDSAKTVCGDWGASDNEFLFFYDDSTSDGGDGWRALFGTNSPDINGSTAPSTGVWKHFAITYNGSGQFIIYEDASEIASASGDGTISTTSATFELGADNGSHNVWEGNMGPFMFWNRELSASEVQAHYDAGSGGYLETATKSFSSSATPDLQNLSYSLNGETIDLNVIGSPGTADEEVVTQTLDGATSYTLSWAASHTDFRLRPEPSTSDVTTSPTFSRGELIV